MTAGSESSAMPRARILRACVRVQRSMRVFRLTSLMLKAVPMSERVCSGESTNETSSKRPCTLAHSRRCPLSAPARQSSNERCCSVTTKIGRPDPCPASASCCSR